MNIENVAHSAEYDAGLIDRVAIYLHGYICSHDEGAMCMSGEAKAHDAATGVLSFLTPPTHTAPVARCRRCGAPRGESWGCWECKGDPK